MKNFLYTFFSLFMLFQTSILSWFFFDNEVNSHEFFINDFILFISINFYMSKSLNGSLSKINLNIDIIFKFLILLFKSPSLFFNYFLIIFKKIFYFLYFFKYRNLKNTIYIYFKDLFCNSFLIWRPLFKKTSYFGYFRSNRSKWIK